MMTEVRYTFNDIAGRQIGHIQICSLWSYSLVVPLQVNRLHWPVPPIYIVNCTQHDVIDARSTIPPAVSGVYRPAASMPKSYNHFEITSLHWGNGVVGYWTPPADLRLSTTMSLSAAATSMSNGDAGHAVLRD